MAVLKCQYSLKGLLALTIFCCILLGGRDLWLRMSKSAACVEISVVGEGYITCWHSDTGEALFMTHGKFFIDDYSLLHLSDSRCVLIPPITIPDGASSIRVAKDGMFSYSLEGSATRIEAGSISLISFPDPSQLKVLPKGLWRYVGASADNTTEGQPSKGKFGTIKQHRSWWFR